MKEKEIEDSSNDTIQTVQVEPATHVSNVKILDTALLQNLGFAYLKISPKKWCLELTDSIPKSKQIRKVSYQITTKILDNSILSHLDCVYHFMSGQVQSFGFNGLVGQFVRFFQFD
ncbi:MAG: hypothetical protein KDC24_09120 [Saprospiraceae bacterium]|nr:hypothetical protein [Saprospiraceae bacterium]